MAEQLAQLALVSKICTELEKHIGMGDKNLAEFLIHLAKESKYDKDKFAKNLESNGAKFPKVLFDSLYNIICVKKKIIIIISLLNRKVKELIVPPIQLYE